ncbi:hypothetical protein [Paraglaciecola sp. L3A3]|uniref:hypothetical protein n=1 Tax=Paraglaciecola sp. L3A3 TaxID=2686358 RepID=UPI00131A75B4|nr:hypothetical protein [Paraglaciecola sp. L3A3]
MHQSHHDTSTQAMTEVALGLSMAFFSLLILALFSIGLPEQALQSAKQQQSQIMMPKAEQLKLAANHAQTAANKSASKSAGDEPQYAFYFNGQFYDQLLKPLSIKNLSSFNLDKPLILAVQDSLPMSQVMAIRKQINHPNLSITMLNNNWQDQLEKM